LNFSLKQPSSKLHASSGHHGGDIINAGYTRAVKPIDVATSLELDTLDDIINISCAEGVSLVTLNFKVIGP
jgi:hypothetical protein